MATQLSASGEAAAFATPITIRSERAYFLSSAGGATATGRARLERSLPQGGLTDFAVWQTGQPDAAMSRVLSPGNAGYGTDATASRAFLSATAPRAYDPAGTGNLWNPAVYAGLGIKWTSVPNGQKHAFHQVQLENVGAVNRLSWDATSWEGRVTYTGHFLSTYAIVEKSTDTALSGRYSGKIIYQGTGNAPGGIQSYTISPVNRTGMAPCVAGERVNASVAVRMGRKAFWKAGIHFYDANFKHIGGWDGDAAVQHPGGDRWATSYAFQKLAPANTAWVAVVPHISPNSTWEARDSIAPVGEVAYCDMHRIWSHPYNVPSNRTPTAYSAPRKLTIDVKANRVNLVNNPGFDRNSFGWGAFGTGSAPFPGSQDSTTGRLKAGSFKFSVPANLNPYGVDPRIGLALLSAWDTANVGGFGLKPNAVYTLSMYVKPGPGCPNITLNPRHSVIAGVLGVDEARTSHPELVEGDWIRLWATIMTDGDADGMVRLSAGVESAAAQATGVGALFWVDDVLCEEGATLMPYFDGNSEGAGYLWSGASEQSSSHYYREFRANAYRLRDIVESAAPHGTQVELRYAQPPR